MSKLVNSFITVVLYTNITWKSTVVRVRMFATVSSSVVLAGVVNTPFSQVISSTVAVVTFGSNSCSLCLFYGPAVPAAVANTPFSRVINRGAGPRERPKPKRSMPFPNISSSSTVRGISNRA